MAARYCKLLADRQRVLGRDHPDTRSTRKEADYWIGVEDAAETTANLTEADRSGPTNAEEPQCR
jgi:hypothetical protein